VTGEKESASSGRQNRGNDEQAIDFTPGKQIHTACLFSFFFFLFLMREDGRGEYFMLCDAFIINDM